MSENRKILVTGASGLVGSWLTKSLIEKGHEVTTLFRDSVPKSIFFSEGLDKKVNVVNGCLEDFASVERAINEYEINSVIHLGAQAIVNTALRSPMQTLDVNVRGTWNVLEACRLHDDLVEAVVVASSDKAYGHLEKGAYKEEDMLCGTAPYDVSKSCCDLIARSYGLTYNLPITISRCGNIYGGGDLNFNRLVPGTILSLLQDKVPVLRSDGTYVRDYIYVKDIVKSYEVLHDYTLKNKPHGDAFNFSTEEKYAVTEIVGAIEKLMGKKTKPKILNKAQNEIKYQHLDSSKAKRILRWKNEYSLESGLNETIAWYSKRYKEGVIR